MRGKRAKAIRRAALVELNDALERQRGPRLAWMIQSDPLAVQRRYRRLKRHWTRFGSLPAEVTAR